MDKQVELPKHVVFKGDNGLYAAAVVPEGTEHVYLQFYNEDRNDLRCSHSIHSNGDGTIRIKSDYYGKFWRRSPNWIWADSDDPTSDNPDTLFRAVKIGENMYALQNLGNGNYCHRLTADYKQSCLNASASNINKEAHLQLEEAVLSRRIYDVEYRFKDAKIYGNKVITLITNEAVNHGSTDNKETLTLTYNDTKEMTWDSSVSMKLGVATTIQAGIPEIASASVVIETEYTESNTWGQSITRTEEHSTNYEVTVRPHTMVTVRRLASEAICEVPFSYSQEDVLTTGEKVVYKFQDGIYRGVNSFNLRIDVSEKNLHE